MPVWKKRHELFAAWVFAQIIEAIEPVPVTVHHVDGRLTFAFAATHLATIDGVSPRVHVWAELRSPLSNPKEKSSNAGIQPDFTLLVEPVTDPRSPILIVECKQYKRASRRNFSDALADYARGRPSAEVVLVNYGPGINDLVARLGPSLQRPIHLIGLLQPRTEALQEFRALVQGVIESRTQRSAAPEVQRTPSLAQPETGTGTITLTWSKKPSDLDLFLEIAVPGTTAVIGWNNPSITATPSAHYDRDVMDGHGPERIEFALHDEARYTCYVHRFSTDAALAGSQAHVSFPMGGICHEIICPEAGEGAFWRVFTLDMTTRTLRIQNAICRSMDE